MTQRRALKFSGIQKTTLADYPNEIACTLFVSGCNFRCPFCYNPDLVLERDAGVAISEDEALDFLEGRKELLDGVCITGGEPLLYYPELKGFIEKAKKLGYKVKLDTNGSNPQALKELIDAKLLDYVAMDIKSTIEKYIDSVKMPVNTGKIKESVDILKSSDVDYEFRTTVHTGITKEDFKSIGSWLSDSKRYFLQQVKLNLALLDPSFEYNIYSIADLNRFAEDLRKNIDFVGVRA
ncbi:anaerobic ribonucleoside-triphosphate reductase activating protein [Candidatus Saganbacteria bacterium]|nr:anaerobic ribonucleoside-triphosphate reductase activating protein [Candidatus Saganbacteria bacterium]